MSNMDFMDKPIDSIFSDSEIKMDELSHHGVLGMSWGERNGPPYPLSGVDKKVARAEAKRKKIQEKRIAKLQKAAKKARKAKVKAAKRQAKALEKQEKLLDKKAKLLEEDNYKKIMKNRKLFTNEELKYIQDRRNQQINDKIDRFMNRAAKITTAANSIMNVTVGLNQLRSLNKQLKVDDLDLQIKNLDLKEKAEQMARDKQMHNLSVTEKKWKLQQERGKARQELGKGNQERFKAFQQGSKALKEESSVASAQISNALDAYNQRKNYINALNADRLSNITRTTMYSPSSDFTLDRRTNAGRRNEAWTDYLVSNIKPNQNGNIYDLVGKDVKATFVTDLDKLNRQWTPAGFVSTYIPRH